MIPIFVETFEPPMMAVKGRRILERILSTALTSFSISAAIYGAQAGNGVVLITTKKGTDSGDGNVIYEYKLTRQTLAKKPGVMNRKQFIDFKKMQGYDIAGELSRNGDDGKIDTDWSSECTSCISYQFKTLSEHLPLIVSLALIKCR